MAKPLFDQQKIAIGTTAWYGKKNYAFSDILAAVRQQIWAVSQFSTSPEKGQVHNLKARIRYLEALIIEAAA